MLEERVRVDLIGQLSLAGDPDNYHRQASVQRWLKLTGHTELVFARKIKKSQNNDLQFGEQTDCSFHSLLNHQTNQGKYFVLGGSHLHSFGLEGSRPLSLFFVHIFKLHIFMFMICLKWVLYIHISFSYLDYNDYILDTCASNQHVGGQAQQWTFTWGFAHLACETCPISKSHRSEHSRW